MLLTKFSIKRPWLWLLLAIFLYCLIFIFLSLWKLDNFLYDNLDLAIFSNSLFNLVTGQGLANQLHPPTYWADHFSPFLYLLAPLYWLAKTPATLLILQTLFLSLSAWPLYLIAKRSLSNNLSLLIAVLWLVNPLVHNVNVYEFSLLPAAAFCLLWTFYFYQQNKFWPFVLMSLLSLSTREDVPLVIVVFALLAWLEKKTWRWRLWPLLVSVGWFLMAQLVISNLSPLSHDKFLIYYQWLGQADLWTAIQHLLTFGNLEFILGLLFPLLFLPLLRPKYLLFILPPLTLFALTESGLGDLLLNTHYAAFFSWPIFLALIQVLAHSQTKLKKLASLVPGTQPLAPLIILASLYSSLTYGALLPLAQAISQPSQRAAQQQLVDLIPPEAKVAATYSLLTSLSSRQVLQILPYAYAGQGQFLLTDYNLQPDIDYLVIDWNEMLLAKVHYQNRYAGRLDASQLPANLQKILADFQPVAGSGNTLLLKRGPALPLADLSPATATTLALNDYQASQAQGRLALNLTFSLPSNLTRQYFLQIKDGQRLYRWSLGYDLFNLKNLSSGQNLRQTVWLDRPTSDMEVSIISWGQGYIYLGPLKNLSLKLPDQQTVFKTTLPLDKLANPAP